MDKMILAETAGEIAIIKKLEDSNWRVRKIQKDGVINAPIEAEKDNLRIVFQVKTAITPNTPPDVSTEEISNIKQLAKELDANPYVAKVWLNDELFNTQIELNKLN